MSKLNATPTPYLTALLGFVEAAEFAQGRRQSYEREPLEFRIEIADMKTFRELKRFRAEGERFLEVLQEAERVAEAAVDLQLERRVVDAAGHLEGQLVVFDGLAEAGVDEVGVAEGEVDVAGGAGLVALVVERVAAVRHRLLQVAEALVAAGQRQVGLGAQHRRVHLVGDVELLEAEVKHLSGGEEGTGRTVNSYGDTLIGRQTRKQTDT